MTDLLMEKWNGDHYIGKRYDNHYIAYGHNRDSDPLTESNFDNFRKILDDQKAEYDIVSFNHWLCGWVEFILIRDDDTKSIEIANNILKRLEDYPVLDDEDFSNREYDLFLESFNDWGYKDAMSELSTKYGITVYDFKEDEFKQLLLDNERGCAWCIEGNGCYIDIPELIEPITRKQFTSVLTDYEVNEVAS